MYFILTIIATVPGVADAFLFRVPEALSGSGCF